MLIIGLWGIRRYKSAATFDPLWLRAIVSFSCFLPIGLSYVSEHVRAHFDRCLRATCYVVTIWFVVLAVLNGLSAGYSFGLLSLVYSVGIFFSLGTRRRRPTVYYVATTTLVLAATAALATAYHVVSTFHVSPVLISSTFAGGGV
ncbi:MAG: hypothetical protein BRD29_01705, partial [Bacteroidetes bacterium QH_2_67_10]